MSLRKHTPAGYYGQSRASLPPFHVKRLVGGTDTPNASTNNTGGGSSSASSDEGLVSYGGGLAALRHCGKAYGPKVRYSPRTLTASGNAFHMKRSKNHSSAIRSILTRTSGHHGTGTKLTSWICGSPSPVGVSLKHLQKSIPAKSVRPNELTCPRPTRHLSTTDTCAAV